MNIFILDSDNEKSVQSYVNKHVVKMCLESCQMLANAYYFTNQEELAPYKINHPYRSKKNRIRSYKDEKGLTIQDKLNPNADSCIDTRFSHINEVLMMFKLDLGKANIVVVA